MPGHLGSGVGVATIDPSAIRQRIAAAISSTLGPAYKESRWAPPLFPDGPAAQDTRHLAHKGYSVYLSTTDEARDGRQARGGVGEYVRTNVHVSFGWRLRADNQVADYDDALDAEKAVIAAVLSVTPNPSLRVRWERVAGRAVTGDGELFVGRLDFSVYHHMATA